MPTARIPIDIVWSGTSGSPGVNVFHGRFDSGEPLGGDLEGLTEILQSFYEDLAPNSPPQLSYRYAGEAQGVGADEGTTYTSSTWSVVGTGSSGFLPPANAMFINWRAASGGRSGRGRTFVGPLSANVTEGDGTPAGPYLVGLQAAADSLISASLSDANGALGIWSRVDGLFRDFVSAQVPNKFAVLRSRRD